MAPERSTLQHVGGEIVAHKTIHNGEQAPVVKYITPQHIAPQKRYEQFLRVWDNQGPAGDHLLAVGFCDYHDSHPNKVLPDKVKRELAVHAVRIAMTTMDADPDKFVLVRDLIVDKLMATKWLDVRLWSDWSGMRDVKTKTYLLDLFASKNKMEVGANPVWFLAAYIQVILRKVSNRKKPFVIKTWEKHHLKEKFLTSCICYVHNMYHFFFIDSVPRSLRTDWNLITVPAKLTLEDLLRDADGTVGPPQETGQVLVQSNFTQATSSVAIIDTFRSAAMGPAEMTGRNTHIRQVTYEYYARADLQDTINKIKTIISDRKADCEPIKDLVTSGVVHVMDPNDRFQLTRWAGSAPAHIRDHVKGLCDAVDEDLDDEAYAEESVQEVPKPSFWDDQSVRDAGFDLQDFASNQPSGRDRDALMRLGNALVAANQQYQTTMVGQSIMINDLRRQLDVQARYIKHLEDKEKYLSALHANCASHSSINGIPTVSAATKTLATESPDAVMQRFQNRVADFFKSEPMITPEEEVDEDGESIQDEVVDDATDSGDDNQSGKWNPGPLVPTKLPQAFTLVQRLKSLDDLDDTNERMVRVLDLFTYLVHLQAYVHPDIVVLHRLVVGDVLSLLDIELDVLDAHERSPHFSVNLGQELDRLMADQSRVLAQMREVKLPKQSLLAMRLNDDQVDLIAMALTACPDRNSAVYRVINSYVDTLRGVRKRIRAKISTNEIAAKLNQLIAQTTPRRPIASASAFDTPSSAPPSSAQKAPPSSA